MRTPRQYRLGVLGHLNAEVIVGAVVVVGDRVEIADPDAPPAADAPVVVDRGFARAVVRDRRLCTEFRAQPAAPAERLVNRRLAALVLLHLPGPAAAAHPDIFDRTAKTGQLVALEMVQAQKDIRIHNRAADLRLFYHRAALDRYRNIIGPLEAVSNQDVASGRKRAEPIFICRLQMLERILAASDIQGVAVGQERHPAQLLYQVRDRLRVVRPQIRQIPRLSEVDLDCGQLAVKVDLPNPRFLQQLFQLVQKARPHGYPQIGKVYRRFFHLSVSSFGSYVPIIKGSFRFVHRLCRFFICRDAPSQPKQSADLPCGPRRSPYIWLTAPLICAILIKRGGIGHEQRRENP